MTIHHVRLVHGSALNTSSKPRRLLLHEYAAADAWPLMGVASLAEFNGRIVTRKSNARTSTGKRARPHAIATLTVSRFHL